jgi:Uma2 family endonuclease
MVYAQAGANRRHNQIAGNIFGLLWNNARGGPCRVYQNDMKLRTADDVFYYPDVMVVCEPPWAKVRFMKIPPASSSKSPHPLQDP